MEYINIINDNANVIINDSYRNLSFVSSWETPRQGAFMKAGNQSEQFEADQYGNYYQTVMNYDELVFISPNGGDSFNKAFIQNNNRTNSQIITPTEYFDIAIIEPTVRHDYDGPYSKLSELRGSLQAHSFRLQKFKEQFPSGKYGTEVYNDAGAMIFTSNNRYLKIKDFIFEPNFMRQFFHVQNGATMPNVSNNKVLSQYTYGGVESYCGTHCHFKRLRYDEPIAICVLNTPATDIKLEGTKNNYFSNGMAYYAFADEYTLDIYGELNYYYFAYEDDSTGEGDNSPYVPTPVVHRQRAYKGNCDTLAIMVIAKNDYL